MISPAVLGQLVVLAVVVFVALHLVGRALDARKGGRPMPVTQAEPAAHIVEALERVAALEIATKTLVRQLTDLDDSVEHRFRRLNARSKREPEAEPTMAEDTTPVSSPFGSANTGGFPNQPTNGRRPFGRGAFGPTR